MGIANGAFTRTNSFSNEAERIIPRFHMACVEDSVASEREKRLISREIERVELIMPGNPYNKPVEQVNDSHRERWPKEYAAFKSGMEMATEGTPLEMWPVLRPSQVQELKYLGFRSVEDLARMDDLSCQRIGMGGQSIRKLAVCYVDDKAATEITSALTAENDKLRNEVADLRSNVSQLSELVNELHSNSQAAKNAPHALATNIPGMSDPVAIAQQAAPQAVGRSSLDTLGQIKRGPGRPRKEPAPEGSAA